MSVTHTVVHRPTLGEHVKADKEKPWEESPFDKISVRSESVLTAMSLKDGWINGYFAMWESTRIKL